MSARPDDHYYLPRVNGDHDERTPCGPPRLRSQTGCHRTGDNRCTEDGCSTHFCDSCAVTWSCEECGAVVCERHAVRPAGESWVLCANCERAKELAAVSGVAA